jgi:hypothetical protein
MIFTRPWARLMPSEAWDVVAVASVAVAVLSPPPPPQALRVAQAAKRLARETVAVRRCADFIEYVSSSLNKPTPFRRSGP